jgi:type IV pilus assembly protein PilA
MYKRRGCIFTSSNLGEKGFTLIELLIVIAVLGVLASVAIPNVTSFIQSGKLAAANSEAAAEMTANQAYAAEHNGVYASVNSQLATFMQGSVRGNYSFSTSTGAIIYGSYSDGGFMYSTASHSFTR